MLAKLIVEEHWVLHPHVEALEYLLFHLSDVGCTLDQLSGQTGLCVHFLILAVLARLQQIRVILVVEELL